MEKYLAKCLDSLLIPEIDEIEVLVVNDGSKDRSSDIAHEYADRYPQSIKVLDKENGNYGSCINAALPVVSGRYVKILDADDSFDSTAFSEFIKAIRGLNADIVFTRCKHINEDGTILSISGYESKTFNMGFIYEDINPTKIKNILMHWITYNVEVFKRFEYFQPEGISYTDDIWAYIPSSFCHSCIFLDLILYQYLLGREGQTVERTKMIKSIPSLLGVAKSMSKYDVKLRDLKHVNALIRVRAIGLISHIYHKIYSFNTLEGLNLLKKFDDLLLKENPDLYSQLGEFKLHKKVNYNFISELRNCNFDYDYKIPSKIKFILQNRSRIDNLKSKLFSRKIDVKNSKIDFLA